MCGEENKYSNAPGDQSSDLSEDRWSPTPHKRLGLSKSCDTNVDTSVLDKTSYSEWMWGEKGFPDPHVREANRLIEPAHNSDVLAASTRLEDFLLALAERTSKAEAILVKCKERCETTLEILQSDILSSETEYFDDASPFARSTVRTATFMSRVQLNINHCVDVQAHVAETSIQLDFSCAVNSIEYTG
jgi:hypothetical protein